MMIKQFDYTNNLDAENFQILYKKYKDALKIIKNLKKENEQLKLKLDTHKHPLLSTEEAGRIINELTELLMGETKKNAILYEEINSLRIENMRLKELKKYD